MLWAAVKAAVEVVEGSPIWMEIRFKRPPFLHGPLRIDITMRRAVTRLQLYIPTGKRPLSTSLFIVARNSQSAGHPLSPWSQIGVADHVEPLGLSKKCVALALQWMQSCTNCEGQHIKCSRPIVPPLPTRVIYVGKSDQDIRLHISRPGETSHYAALSHCWGGVIPIQTTLDRLEQYTLSIPTPLPQTFADAISVTRALGIPYIWIDSLCIVQDSKDDWVGEAAGMANVYSNSFLTISADAATNSFTKFLNAPARTVPPAKSITYSICDSDGARAAGSIYVRAKGALAQELPFHVFRDENSNALIRDYLAGQASGVRSKLSTRGWVLQERLLSPRTLHFSKYEMAWECQSVIGCECSTNSVRSKRTTSNLKGLLVQPREAVIASWRENIVPTYISLDLTFKSDRLLAIAGLATAIGRVRRDVYVADIWKESADDLLWYISALEGGTKTGAENVPSWSWAAVDGQVAFFTIDDRTRFAKHVSLQLRNVVENPCQYGTPAYRPSLLVFGLLIPVRTSAPDVETQYLKSRIRHVVFISSLKGDLQTTAIYDSMPPLEKKGSYYFFLMTTGQVGPVGLLLVQSGVDGDCFERVGPVADISRLIPRIWSDNESNWFSAREERADSRKDIKNREKAWKNWKKVARKQIFKIV